VPALRAAVRARAPEPVWAAAADGMSEAEALGRLLLHPAPGVAAPAAVLAESPLAVEPGTEEADPRARESASPPVPAAEDRSTHNGVGEAASPADSFGGNPAKRIQLLARARAEPRS